MATPLLIPATGPRGARTSRGRVADVRPEPSRPAEEHVAAPRPVFSLRRRATAWTVVLLGLPALTVAGVPYRSADSLTVVVLTYVLAVVAIAVLGGIAPAVAGALMSFLLANFFLTDPYYTFEIGSQEHIVELLLFVVVGVLVSVTVEAGARNRAVQTARARELQETDRTRSAILAAVSHDLRTPLSAIKVAVSTLRQPDITWSAEERAELLMTIEDGADRLDGVVTNLLALTRIQAGAVLVRRQPVVADEVVARAVISLGGTAANLSVDVPEDLPTAVADPDLLERVLANLVANALRFDPEGTEVRARTLDDRVEITVLDHGPGVPSERWEEMFTAFRRLDDRDGHIGTGLGLAIARGFCDAMGASLTAAETPGGGLTMAVVLETA